MIELNEIIEVISQDFEGDSVDYGEITEIISEKEVIVNLQSDSSLYCRAEMGRFNVWYLTEDIDEPIDITCRF